MRVALLAPAWWPEVRRGSERFIRDLADGLLAAGHQATLITSHPGRPSRSVEDGLEVIRNWRPPEGRLRRRGYQPFLTHLPFSYQSLARGSFDVAHALYATDALAAQRWSRRGGGPVVVSLMGLPERAGLVSVRGRVDTVRRVVSGASAAVCLSEEAAAAFERELGVALCVIEPGVNLARFRPVGERAQTPTVFCPAARSEPRKRVAVLEAAVAQVRERMPEVRLVLEGPADDAGLVRAYGSAWVTCLPSVSEAFGLVLVESLACGTPVVCVQDGHPPAIVGEDAAIGRVAAVDDPRSLADALLEALALAGEPSTPARCRTRAEAFPAARCAAAYEALYREVLGRRSGGPRS